MRRLDPCLAPAGYSPRRYAPLSPAPVLGMGERMTDLRDIQALFANGEQGGYWPADPAYAYEDSAGTIAASVNGVVGLRFDVSKRLALGVQILANPNFDGGLTGWDVIGADGTHTITAESGGVRYISDTSTPVLGLRQRFMPSGFYKIEVNIEYTSGILKPDHPVLSSIALSNGVNILYLYYPSLFTFLLYRGSENVNVLIKSARVTNISSVFAIQATTANKPYLRRTPATGKYWYDSNTATCALTATFSGSLGSSCTIATVTPEGVSILENQTVGSTYNICPSYGYNSDVLIINRALTTAEKSLVTRVMQRSVPMLGSNLVVNGTFASDTDWTKGTGWSIGSGVATKSAGSASNLTQTMGVSGNQYRVTADITRAAGTVGAYNGSAQIGATAATETAAKYAMKTTSTTVGFRADSSFAGSVDNAVIQEII